MYNMREKEELRMIPRFWCEQLKCVIVEMKKIDYYIFSLWII